MNKRKIQKIGKIIETTLMFLASGGLVAQITYYTWCGTAGTTNEPIVTEPLRAGVSLTFPEPDPSIMTIQQANVGNAEDDQESEEEEVIFDGYICQWADLTLTESEFDLICKTVECEGGNQSNDTKQMLALVILNRILSGYFPNNAHDVIYAKNQFAVTRWSSFETHSWTGDTEEAVLSALECNDYSREMLYFRSGHFHSWATDYIHSGDMYFSLR